MKVPKLLKLLRVYNDISQTEMAKRIKKYASHVSRLEKGERSISLEIITAYCEMANIKCSDFFRIIEECNDNANIIELQGYINTKVGGEKL